MSWIHPDAFGKGLLCNTLFLQPLQQHLERRMLQVLTQTCEILHLIQPLGVALLEKTGIVQKRDGKSGTMMATAISSDVAATGRSETAPVYLNGYSVRTMITLNLGDDLGVGTSLIEELAHIPPGLITWIIQPVALDSCCEVLYV